MTALEWRRPEVSPSPRRAAGGWETGLRVPVKVQRLVELQRAADGQDVPCMTTDRQLWVSENRRERRTAARLRRLVEASRDSAATSGERDELGRELVRLSRSGHGTSTLARAAGLSRPTVAYALTAGYRKAAWAGASVPGEDDPDAARLAGLRDRAGVSGPGWRRADPELVAERNRLLRRLRNRDCDVRTLSRLGKLAGLTESGVDHVLRPERGVVVNRAPRPQRAAVIAAEVEARAADPRLRRLAELRAWLADASRRVDRVERAERARLVVELWREDSAFWSGRHLAVAAGTSSAWVSGVVKAALHASAGEGGVR